MAQGTPKTTRSRAASAETAVNTRATAAEATPAAGPATASTATSHPEEARAQATGTTSDSGPVDTEPVGAVTTTDGVEHVGTVPATAELVNPLPSGGDHDRVAMLSVRADGTADQHDPEIVVDVAVARAATREQFTQQAVSAADAQLAAQSTVTAGSSVTIIGTPEGQPDRVVPLTTDATSAATELQALHEEVVEAAVAAADAAVDRLTDR